MDMKPRLPLRLSLVLFAVFMASCAPAASTVTPDPPARTVIESTAAVALTQPALESPTEINPVLPIETLVPTPFPVATSRGPNLEATDPSTVNLASGQLQFVEFFRFT